METMKVNNRNVYVFDNKGETLDRYSIIIASTGDVIGCSESPFHSIGQFSHNEADSFMNTTYGYSWRQRCNVKACTKEAVNNWIGQARADKAWIGEEVTNADELPADVIKFIKQAL